MDIYELVRAITQEVLQNIQKGNVADCVLVLGERDAGLAAKVRESLESEADVLFFGEDAGSRKPGRIILPLLSCTAMGDLASGKAADATSSEVLRLLLSGTEVEVLEFEYTSYSETAPGPLYSLYEAYKKTLATFGLVEFRRKRPDTFRFWEELVTAEVVTTAMQNGASTLAVPVTAKITPLAEEAAKNLNINILKRL